MARSQLDSPRKPTPRGMQATEETALTPDGRHVEVRSKHHQATLRQIVPSSMSPKQIAQVAAIRNGGTATAKQLPAVSSDLLDDQAITQKLVEEVISWR